MLKKLIVFSLSLPCFLMSTEFSPWLSRDFEIETRGTILYQNYNHINTGHGRVHRHANDQFYTLSADISGLNWSAEIETTLANTHSQRPALDNLRITGRYRLFNDIEDDWLTITPGFTLTKAFKHSVRDVSSFHHGEIEAELTLALGREFSCGAFWQSRWWTVLGVGEGDHGYPWLRGDLNWDYNWWDLQQLRLFAHTLWGLGHKNISNHPFHFHGYGPIRHQSVDLGIRYSYLFEFGGTFSLEYARRVYAHNFPAQANLILAQFLYPFGL